MLITNDTTHSPFPFGGSGEVRELKHLGLGLREGEERKKEIERRGGGANSETGIVRGKHFTSLSAAILRTAGRALGLPGRKVGMLGKEEKKGREHAGRGLRAAPPQRPRPLVVRL